MNEPAAPAVPETSPDPETSPAWELPAPDAPALPQPAADAPPLELVPTRRLLPTAFDLLTRSSEDLRRASFYVGAMVLGTVGPLALGSWALTVIGVERPPGEMAEIFDGGGAVFLAVLVAVATLGLVAASIESRTLAVAVLGGALADRPITTRRALARSRTSFWRAVAVSIIVAVPVGVAQAVVNLALEPVFGPASQASVLWSTLVSALIGAPFAYALAGVVLGDVDPVEALRRSFRVFRARKLAAVIVVVFESIAVLLIFLGISAGLELVLRAFEAIGLGPDAGPAGLALVTIAIVAVTFAFGTLLFTVMALTVAPQVVMFLGLTHATFGLDRVGRGGPDDPDVPARVRPPFRWFTRPLLLGFVVGALALAGLVAVYR